MESSRADRKSLREMVEELYAYQQESSDLSEWADTFITSVYERLSKAGGDSQCFSGKQADKIIELYIKYIA